MWLLSDAKLANIIDLDGTTYAVAGSDAYVASYVMNTNNPPNNLVVYWKNGTQVTLSAGAKNANATGIVLSGNDVYVCGWFVTGGLYNRATYWKNGSALVLTGENTPFQAFGMTV